MKSPRLTREFLNEAIRFALGNSIVISRIHVDDDIWSVEYEPDRIREMIMDLATKAGVNMPKATALEVEAINHSTGLNEAPHFGAGEYVRVSIVESGRLIAGIYCSDSNFTPGEQQTEETVDAGLCGVYAISRRSEGGARQAFWADRAGVFDIYLPASANTHEKYAREKTGSFAGRGRVLLMDDEEMIRDMAGQMLDYIGYEVVLVSAGGEAVERYKDSCLKGNPFDIVILDLTIRGGMDGKETIKALMTIDPTVKAVLSSGKAFDPAITYFEKYGFRALLPKPYTIDELINVLQEVLLRQKT
jgi:CheY-like chemotaxis protein